MFAGDAACLGRLLLEVIPKVPGARTMCSHVGIGWLSGVRWRLGALSTSQRSSVADVEAGADRAEVARTRVFDEAERSLYLALQRDGRASYRELARAVDLPEHQVRRQISSLVRRGMLSFRTDFARGQAGWPTELVLWLTVAQDQVEQVGATLAEWPETRICMATAGVANMMLMAQVHRFEDLARVRERLSAACPAVQVRDARVVLRAVKSWGRLLDAAGHATGVVPVDPWAVPDADFQLSLGRDCRDPSQVSALASEFC